MTFDEFFSIVRHSFHNGWKSLTDEEVNDYLNSEMEYIHSEYERISKKYEDGEINLIQFRNTASGATGGCLILMY